MRLIDLSTAIDAAGWEPDPVTHEIVSAKEGARHMAREMREHFGVDFDPSTLPGGELLSLDRISLTSHTGTHVDAPSHYGTPEDGGRPADIDEMPLDWFVRPGVVLDISDAGVGTVGPDRLEQGLKEAGHTPSPLDIVLLRTGADRHAGTQRYFTDFVGLDGPAVEFLLDFGVRVIGTDAFSLDAPFTHMIGAYQKTGDPSVLWPAHLVGRHRPYCQIERLSHLEDLPSPHGFTVSALPVRISGAGAGWTRAVAWVDR
ncbi:cyclase family protein [Nocardiopsis alkaliphila]|uniref:cyclase family protein n=1 Tax=Nocardiopsis alkaliphila TaxID=225762 RepID=UPI00034A79ED|nr:cyclase family protein [Nocardiopsis alkaliphila]